MIIEGVGFIRCLYEDNIYKPDHACFNTHSSFGYFDRFHVEENWFVFVVFRFRHHRMQQDAASRVDQEGVGEPAEMKVDNGTKQCVDRYIYTRDALKVAFRNDWQTCRCHHPYNIILQL